LGKLGIAKAGIVTHLEKVVYGWAVGALQDRAAKRLAAPWWTEARVTASVVQTGTARGPVGQAVALFARGHVATAFDDLQALELDASEVGGAGVQRMDTLEESSEASGCRPNRRCCVHPVPRPTTTPTPRGGAVHSERLARRRAA